MDRWLKDHWDWLVDFLRIYLGGVLILSGLLTRFAAILQVPVVIEAVLFIHAKEGFRLRDPIFRMPR